MEHVEQINNLLFIYFPKELCKLICCYSDDIYYLGVKCIKEKEFDYDLTKKYYQHNDVLYTIWCTNDTTNIIAHNIHNDEIVLKKTYNYSPKINFSSILYCEITNNKLFLNTTGIFLNTNTYSLDAVSIINIFDLCSNNYWLVKIFTDYQFTI